MRADPTLHNKGYVCVCIQASVQCPEKFLLAISQKFLLKIYTSSNVALDLTSMHPTNDNDEAFAI